MTQDSSVILIDAVPLMQALSHAYKYSHLPVCGLFLGSSSLSSKDSSEPRLPMISDYLPLLHSSLSVTLWIDIAVDQVRLYLQEQISSELQVIGFYYASDTAFQKNEEVATQILQALEVTDGVICKLDTTPPSKSSSKSLPLLCKSLSTPYHLSLAKTSEPWTTLLPLCLPLAWKVNDFEDHLDDVEINWLENPTWKKEIHSILKKVDG